MIESVIARQAFLSERLLLLGKGVIEMSCPPPFESDSQLVYRLDFLENLVLIKSQILMHMRRHIRSRAFSHANDSDFGTIDHFHSQSRDLALQRKGGEEAGASSAKHQKGFDPG